MQIGDRVQVCEAKHPFHTFTGTVIGFRGQRGPDDKWVLIYMDNRGRSYLIPQSMVKLLAVVRDEKQKIDPYGGKF
jgi:hypothetical protein